jgi:hypothetical protein
MSTRPLITLNELLSGFWREPSHQEESPDSSERERRVAAELFDPNVFDFSAYNPQSPGGTADFALLTAHEEAALEEYVNDMPRGFLQNETQDSHETEEESSER